MHGEAEVGDGGRAEFIFGSDVQIADDETDMETSIYGVIVD